MKNLPFLLLACCLFVLGCDQQPPAAQPSESAQNEASPSSAAGAELEKERMKFKNMAFCNCLHEANPDTNFWKKEGSAGGYLETGIFGMDQIEMADSVAKIYLQKDYPSCCESKLFLMKCLDFYNGEELNSIANTITIDSTSN